MQLGYGSILLTIDNISYLQIPPKKAPLPNILKPYREPSKGPTPLSTVTSPLPPPMTSVVATQPTVTGPPYESPPTPKSSLDDLLKLGPPLQSLDLPPLEADLGDFMMAEEEEGN